MSGVNQSGRQRSGLSQEDRSVMGTCALFAGMAENEMVSMMDCLEARVKSYSRGSFLLRAGETAEDVGVLLSGRVQVIREELSGHRSLLAGASVGELFAEAYACLGVRELPVSVEASEDCRVLWLNVKKIVTVCSSACRFHSRLIGNMLQVLAGKNAVLNEKVQLLSLKTTRDKLLQYLCECARRAGTKRFVIGYNRSELADFLGVDRSAMSRELSRMRADGLLEFERNRFELLF